MIYSLYDWLSNSSCFSLALAINVIDSVALVTNCVAKEDQGKAVLAVYIAAKDVSRVFHN